MSAILKKGWCPSLTRPMESGDGLLVRLYIKEGIVTAPHARAVAAAATRYGNGHIDLTSRGNLQIRGVTAEHYNALLAEISALGLAQEQRPPRVDTQSEIPSLGFMPFIPSPLGGGLGWGPSCASEQAGPPPSLLPNGGGVIGLGVAFGRIEVPGLLWLADQAEHYGDGTIRLSPWRAVFLPGIAASAAEALLREAIANGFITDNADARRMIQACPGAPACSSAQGETRALALALAEALPGLAASGRIIHVSGCAKGCACSRPTSVAIIAHHNGYDVAFDSTAAGTPDYRMLSMKDVIQKLFSSPLPLPNPPPQRAGEGTSVSPLPVGGRVREGAGYIRDGAAIYRQSFAIIRAEADLARFNAEEEKVAVRIIHACGMVELAKDIIFSDGMVARARKALQDGAPILCDAKMVASGITRKRLPANNEVICTLDDPRVAEMAKAMGNTRSAAAMELWRERLGGALVVVGNAPTSLFRLLEMLDGGAALPAAVIGMPVGFVGAAESKEALAADGRVPFAIVRGRKGGSAMAVAAVNAIASEVEI